MTRLKIIAVAIAVCWYVFVAWAAKHYSWAAEHWWGTSAIVTFLAFGLYRLAMQPTFGGDAGATEERFLTNWLPPFVGFWMCVFGVYVIWFSLTSKFGDGWGAVAGAAALLGGFALLLQTAQRRRR